MLNFIVGAARARFAIGGLDSDKHGVVSESSTSGKVHKSLGSTRTLPQRASLGTSSVAHGLVGEVELG